MPNNINMINLIFGKAFISDRLNIALEVLKEYFPSNNM